MSKCHIVGNHMHWLINVFLQLLHQTRGIEQHQLTVMFTTSGERDLRDNMFKVQFVLRQKKGRASLVLNCSCGYTFHPRFALVFVLAVTG